MDLKKVKAIVNWQKLSNITDFINRIVQIVRRELDQLSIRIQEAELIGPVKP